MAPGGNMGKRNRRKIILINKSFQYKLIAKFIILNTTILIIFAGFIYLFFNSELDSNLHPAHVTFKNMKEMLFPIITTLSLINIIISSIIIWIYILFASHKLAGPMYRFNQALDEIGDRNLKPLINLREGDQYIEISSSFEKMTGLLVDDISTIQDGISRLKETSHDVSKSDETKKIIGELDKKLKEYKY